MVEDYRFEDGKREFYFGIGAQPVAVYRHKLKMQILGSRETIEVEVGFTDAPGVDAILGQADFFEHYHIKFERNKERLELKHAAS